MDPRPPRYRDEHRATKIGPRYSGAAHLALTTTLSVAGIVFAALHVAAPSPGEWLTVPISFFVANVAEYLGHRGPMHHRYRGLGALFQRHAGTHHRFFVATHMHGQDRRDWQVTLFPPVLVFFFLGVLAGPIAGGLFFLVSPNAGWLFLCTGLTYFLCYEWLHLSYHASPGFFLARLPFVRALARHHTVHHDPAHMARHNFNITFPIVDALAGTLFRG
jgi:hypothetical protein